MCTTPRTVHYVGMSEDRYQQARKVWGGPAYYHKWLDDRVWTEVGDNDIVIVAADARYSKYVWDASAVDSKWTS